FELERETVLPGEYKDSVEVPYAHEAYDMIVEDSGNGDGEDLMDEMSEIVSEYDEIVLAGGYLNDCLETFMNGLEGMDGNVEIDIDMKHTFTRKESQLYLRRREEVLKMSREEREKVIARKPKWAPDNSERVREFRRNRES
ncbi:MAG: hypothetical protein ABEJ72_07425, partial [Candidatus Aenigmatarchaeota archaeon]